MTDLLITTAASNANKFTQELIRRDLEELLRTPPAYLQPGNYVPANYVQGSNGTLRFLAIPDLSVVTGTPSAGTRPWLTEGVPPDAELISYAYDEMTAYQAGRLLKFSDLAQMENLVDLLSAISNRVARNMLMTVDKYLADIVSAGTNILWSDHGVNGNNSIDDVDDDDVLERSTIIQAVTMLKAAGVPTFPDGSYHAIAHPYVTADLMLDTAAGGWTDANRYVGSGRALLNGEIGSILGVRFLESNDAHTFADSGHDNQDTYCTTVFGPGAFAFGDFGTAEVIITPPGGQSDPLKQVTKVGWKAMFGAALLDAAGARYVNIVSSSSLTTATGS